MQMNDMVLISADDHICEPPNMFDNQLSGGCNSFRSEYLQLSVQVGTGIQQPGHSAEFPLCPAGSSERLRQTSRIPLKFGPLRALPDPRLEVLSKFLGT
jgi:hypothetical protein